MVTLVPCRRVADPEPVDETPITPTRSLTGAGPGLPHPPGDQWGDRACPPHLDPGLSGRPQLVGAQDRSSSDFFTGTVWSAPLHPGVLGILVGSVLIARDRHHRGTPDRPVRSH